MTKGLSAALAVLLIAASPQLALARAAQDMSACLSDHPDQWIPACTAIIKRGKAAPGDLAKAYYNRANAHSDRGEWNLAIQDYDKAIAIDPKFAAAYLYRGRAHDGRGDFDLAIRDFEKAIALYPKSAGAYRLSGVLNSSRGEHDLAIRYFDKAILTNPKDVEAYTLRGIELSHKGEYDLAVRDFSQAITLRPALDFDYFLRGDAYFRTSEFGLAVQDFDKAIALIPKGAVPETKRTAASVRCSAGEMGEFDLAIQDFVGDSLFEPNKAFALAYAYRGLAQWKQGHRDLAMKDVEQATAFDACLSSAKDKLELYRREIAVGAETPTK